MLTSSDITRLVDTIGKPGSRGLIESLKRNNRGSMGGTNLTSSQRTLLTQVANVPASGKPTPAYSHPARQPHLAGAQTRTGPLTPAEVTFLDRLPRDPSEVSYADATEVFRLLATADPAEHRSDLPLLRSIADPLREHHDGNAAQADLVRAQQPLHDIPASALSALADAIGAEYDQLQPTEVIARANTMLSDIGSQRVAKRFAAINAAETRISEVTAAQTARTAVTR